jgi:hypothetical protein
VSIYLKHQPSAGAVVPNYISSQKKHYSQIHRHSLESVKASSHEEATTSILQKQFQLYAVRPTQDLLVRRVFDLHTGLVFTVASIKCAIYTSPNALDGRLRLRLRSHCQFSAKASFAPSGLPLHLRPISKRQFVLSHRTKISCTQVRDPDAKGTALIKIPYSLSGTTWDLQWLNHIRHKDIDHVKNIRRG